MKIGLFFGSFNPIHIGHLIIAEYITNFYTQKVWFIISPQNPFKENTELLEVEKRMLLTSVAIKGNEKFEISNIELTLSVPSYTINTLKYLKNLYPEDEFFLIVGSDNYLNIPKWKCGDTILSDYKIIIYERSGFFISSQQLHSNTILAQAPLMNISSSYIRKLISSKKSIRYLVPSDVESLIRKNNYYN